MLRDGDRVRWATTGEDGLPELRYGFVGSIDEDGYAIVLFDGELKGSTRVPLDELAPVSITAIELRLSGCDLLDDPSLRQGLVSLWSAEADDAGLDIDTVYRLSESSQPNGCFTLAELESGGCQFVLNASVLAPTNEVWVRAVPH